MSLVARELDTATAQAWFDALPEALRARSLSPDFGAADTAREPGLHCLHIGVEDDGLRGAGASPARWLLTTHLRAAARGQTGERAAIAPYGYGGPLCNSCDAGFVARAWVAWQAWAAAHGVLGEFCRFQPQVDHTRFFGGEVLFNRMTISVDLQLDDPAAQYNTLARRKIRKAQAGAVQRWSRADADWAAFGPFYRQAMAAMGAQPRYHFGDGYFESLSRLAGVDLCILQDEQDGRWLSAGVYLFQQLRGGAAEAADVRVDSAAADGVGTVGSVEYHLGCSSAEGHARGTAYWMQHAAVLEGHRRGLANLFLGGGITPDADHPLFFYKRCFSRRELPFSIGRAVHDPAGWQRFVMARGHTPDNAPANILFE